MYRKNSSGWMKHWDFELLDIVLLEFTFFLSYILRHPDNWYEMPRMYGRLGVLMLIIDIVVIFFSEGYKNILERRKGKELECTRLFKRKFYKTLDKQYKVCYNKIAERKKEGIE